MNKRPDIAYYYPAPFWGSSESGWIKSLLLFFDEIAILLPSYMHGRHRVADPSLVEPLEDYGLLRVLDPNQWIDKKMVNQMSEIIVDMLTNGTFDDLQKTEYFYELSQSRIGYSADAELADFLVDELHARGLARPSEDGASIPLHPAVRTTILVILSQLSRATGLKHGLTIHPTTNHNTAVKDLVDVLSRDRMPSHNKVIKFDLEPVSLNLESIPLDELLQFRVEHEDAHKAYIRNLQRFMTELSTVDVLDDRKALFFERQQQISSAAHELRASTQRAFRKKLASWSLALAGSTWSLSTGDILGTALAATSLAQEYFKEPKNVSAYSYLVDIQHSFQD